MNRLLVFVLATLTALLGLHPGTTTASAATYTYDAPALARVDARTSAPLGNGQWARVGVRERSVLPPVQVRGASTTFLARSIATEAAAGSSIDDILRPGGDLLGQAGSSTAIREVSGGLSEAQATFNQLTQGGTVVSNSTYPGTLVRLADGGTVGIRTVMSNSPNTAVTIDVNIPGFDITKIKFNP